MSGTALARGAALLAALLGCGPAVAPDRPGLPTALLVPGAQGLVVGEVSTLHLLVVTPPEHHLRPYAPPGEIEGLWLLSAEARPVEKQTGRWLHRTDLRVRPRRAGALRWPASRLRLEIPGAEAVEVGVEALELRVAAVAGDAEEPPASRRPRPRAAAGRLGLAFGAGAGAALSLLALLTWWRRRPARRPLAARTPAWIEAEEALARARAQLEDDPIRAAHATATLLRRYADARFQASTRTRTLEEIRAAAAPYLGTTRWPRLLALLTQLDELRLRPETSEGESRHRATSLWHEARSFVRESTPRQELR